MDRQNDTANEQKSAETHDVTHINDDVSDESNLHETSAQILENTLLSPTDPNDLFGANNESDIQTDFQTILDNQDPENTDPESPKVIHSQDSTSLAETEPNFTNVETFSPIQNEAPNSRENGSNIECMEGLVNCDTSLDVGATVLPGSDDVTGQGSKSSFVECTACQQPIKDRYLLKVMGMYWHEDCLKCSCCDCRLGEVGQTLYTKANLLLCRRDYLRLFGNSGTCVICRKMVPAFEMVMKVKNNVYHLECFACQQCRQRFCVGDKFYLCENRILCEYDFEEQNLITSIQRGYNALSHMRRQAETLSDISSGYGSPSPGTL